ncbi:MAG: virulence RhuM family protein [Muribaculaceae bacterium]|nr:virulence RhuM family protein [Muribaculaceae bacterium]
MNDNQSFSVVPASEDNEIILYQPDSTVKLEVRLENETVWLTQQQIADLFGVKQPAISKHLKNIFESGELIENSVHSILEYTATDGKAYKTKFYNLDAILSVGYRVNSRNATLFRQWANKVLKEYLMRGHVVSQRFERLEYRVAKAEEKIDFFVRTSLPPREGIFFDGQIFDAYTLMCDLVRSAKRRIVMIDNYIADSVFIQLDKRLPGVSATIFTPSISRSLRQDLEKHNSQYAPIEIKTYRKAHDRFLIIDDHVYHVGASFKDLGKKLFAFSKMEATSADELIARLETTSNNQGND